MYASRKSKAFLTENLSTGLTYKKLNIKTRQRATHNQVGKTEQYISKTPSAGII